MSKPNFGHPNQYMDKPVAAYPKYFIELAKDLPKGMTVLDLFGGIGLLARDMWDTLQPRFWACLEIDPSLQDNVLDPRVRFLHGDAFQTLLTDDLVIIDPDRCTLNQIWKDPKWEKLFMRLSLDFQVKYILMQEYGAYWCHLPNQIPLYKQLSGGEVVTRATYPDLFARKMYDWFDLKVTKYVQGLGSTYYLMEKE